MTISSSTNRNDYVGNNTTATYSYSFKIFSKNDLLVTQKNTSDVETTLVVDTDYTVTGVGDVNGGTIVLTAGNLATNYTLTIRRVTTLTQVTDIRNQGDYYPEAIEDEFDKRNMIDQQQQDELDRSVKLPESIPATSFDPTLPATIDELTNQNRSIVINSDGDGLALGPTADEIANAQTYAEQAEAARDATNSTDISYYQGISQKTRNKIGALLETDGIKFAVLGDSTEAGVGNGSDSAYGQCRDLDNCGYPNLVAYALMAHDPNFIAPRDDIYPVAFNDAGFAEVQSSPYKSLDMTFPCWQLKKSSTPSFQFRIDNRRRINRSKLRIYHLERTSDAACTFDIKVEDEAGNTLYDDTIDTYVANDTIGTVSGGVAVGGRIGSTEITLSQTDRNLFVTIDNVITVDRGSGVSADGTAVIFGFSTGPGVQFLNLAVSSTTIEEDSAANVSRQVTTTERRQKAESFGANMFLIGWGTNDSKDGGLTTTEFETEYKALIDDIWDYDDEAIIIAANDPTGLADPYDNNPAYNEKIREIAREKKVDLMDVEQLFLTVSSGNYSDNVHPSTQGYETIAAAMCQQLGIAFPGYSGLDLYSFADGYPPAGQLAISGNQSDATSSWVEIDSIASQPRPRWAAGVEVSAKINSYDTTDFDHQYRIKIGSVELDYTRVTGLAVSSVAFSCAYLKGVYYFSQTETTTATIALQGYNYKTRTTDDSTKLYYRWLPYPNA